jgi:prepilin-type N-terminal cleavage/methylation domain-containing protein
LRCTALDARSRFVVRNAGYSLPALAAEPKRTPPRQPLGPSGFTLIELSIVVLVLAVAASFVIPRLRETDSAALASSAARLATTARLLYEEAAFRQTPMRLNLDLDKQAYWVTVFRDDPETPEFVPDATLLTRPVALPDAVAFADVVLPAFGTVKEGVVFAQFFPEGWADPLLVHLMNRRSEYATMAIEPLTGRTRVGDGYIELGASRPGESRPARPGAAAESPHAAH